MPRMIKRGKRSPESRQARKQAREERRQRMSDTVRQSIDGRLTDLETQLKHSLEQQVPEGLSPQEKTDYENEVDLIASCVINSLNNYENGVSREYTVSAILDFQIHYVKVGQHVRNNPMYKVKWEDYQEPTWEPIENLQACAFVDSFWSEKSSQPEWKVVWVDKTNSSE